MNELLPGILHWTATHPKIKMEVSSYFVTGSGTLIDPLRPPDAELEPERVVLTTRHHLRDSESFGVPILCHESGLHEFEGGPDVQGFAWGDQLAPDVRAVEVDAISPDDTGLLIDAGDGVLAIGDAVMHYTGEVQLVPDRYLVDEGDDPEPVKVAIREAIRGLLDEPFDAVLFAHGAPIASGGKDALRRFAER